MTVRKAPLLSIKLIKPSGPSYSWSKGQKVDSAIHRLNLYPVDSAVAFLNTSPLDSDLSGG